MSINLLSRKIIKDKDGKIIYDSGWKKNPRLKEDVEVLEATYKEA